MANPTSRVNSSGLLEILQSDTNAYVQAVALIQLASGFNVALTSDQLAILTAIANSAASIPQILTQSQAVNSSNQAISTTANTIQTVLQNNTNPALVAIINALAGLQTSNTGTLTQLLATNNLISNSIVAPLANISSKSLDYSTQLTILNNSLTTLNNTVAASARGSTPTIATKLLNAVDTQVSYTLPTNTKTLMFKCQRNVSGIAYDIRYSFFNNAVNNLSANNFRTLEAYNEYREDFGAFNGTLYLASSSASSSNPMTIEVEAWS